MTKPSSDIYVIKVIDEYTVVINKGSKDGIKQDQGFLIYSISDEPLIDPVTNENLDYLEVVKGRATIKHLQEKICTLRSSQYSSPTKTIRKERNPILSPFGSTVEEVIDDKELLPLDDPIIGDLVKLI